jgi:drug/metabolite transporter (DMT)-like permease
MNRRRSQFGLASLFAMTAGVAVIAWLGPHGLWAGILYGLLAALAIAGSLVIPYAISIGVQHVREAIEHCILAARQSKKP